MASWEGRGLLFAATDPDPAHEADWNRWYDQRHVPQREALPGALGARRFESVDGGPKYVALYDFETPDTLTGPEYRALSQPPILNDEDRLNIARFVGLKRAVMRQIAQAGCEQPLRSEVGGLLVVALDPQPGYEEEFNAWYNEEHIVFGARVPGVLRVRRFQALEGEPHYVALWDLKDPTIPSTPAFRAAVETPWTHRIRNHYTRAFRGIYKPR